jgi:hypothetical protein
MKDLQTEKKAVAFQYTKNTHDEARTVLQTNAVNASQMQIAQKYKIT